MAPSPRQPNGAAAASSTANGDASSSSSVAIVAKRVSASPSSLSSCGARLRSGLLVSFPTETVYGLGCHALDPDAVRLVFEAKERPLSDPLIVHVTEKEDALRLWSASSSSSLESESVEALALRALSSTFWPGPLTVVAVAHPSVPPIVTASTGYVACRSPSHPVARSVIREAGVPIAAPSANKFGHVSPTRADHVLDDLGGEDVWVIDPGMTEQDGDGSAVNGQAAADIRGVCDVGVESTVAKVEMTSATRGAVTVLRHGAVSALDIRRALTAAGLGDEFEVTSLVRATADHVPNVAPGQTIRHYSPRVRSYAISAGRYGRWTQTNGDGASDLTEEETDLLRRAAVVDFGGRLSALAKDALAYRDLSVQGSSKEAASAVFEALRWAEDVGGAERVYFPEIPKSGEGEGDEKDDDALSDAVRDRLTRAASGEIVDGLR
uniref:Threonylcarbamoyl-AMP synthase n=1 Tax=Trieres chinensis TaxID=1514140 RepID=A0A7S1Z841_TRICV